MTKIRVTIKKQEMESMMRQTGMGWFALPDNFIFDLDPEQVEGGVKWQVLVEVKKEENKRLREALNNIMTELGVPQPGSSHPVTNAYNFGKEALSNNPGSPEKDRESRQKEHNCHWQPRSDGLGIECGQCHKRVDYVTPPTVVVPECEGDLYADSYGRLHRGGCGPACPIHGKPKAQDSPQPCGPHPEEKKPNAIVWPKRYRIKKIGPETSGDVWHGSIIELEEIE